MIGLGLDAGGSATRWAVVGDDGAMLGSGTLAPVDGHLFNPANRERFVAMAAGLAEAAGCFTPDAVVAGITGLTGGSDEAETATAIISAALGIAQVRVEDDLWIGYHDAFAPGAGHVVYAGTGSVGLHIKADGTLLRVGGRGMLIDDGGSAFWIGREGLNTIYRRIDANQSPGALGDALFAAIGGADWNVVRAYVYGGGRNAVAMLAMAVAGADDPAAAIILDQAGRELARLARDLVQRIGVLPVALQGRAASLHPGILAAMRAAAPGLDITLHQADAALAAAKLANGNGRV
ncbi:MAG: ATPase [Acetobacteraceae bacterium]|nr:ATPase [Acetobacteraceae bacterium]